MDLLISLTLCLLTAAEQISSANITLSDGVLIAGKSSVNLTCEAQGSSITREWTKDDNPLSPSNRITFSADNKIVSINPVEKDDNGVYKCKLNNAVSDMEAKQTLIVNYGPERPHIEGKEVIELGRNINLTCSAESIPWSSYTWAHNGTETGVTGASYVKVSVQNDGGIYTCTALNSITGITSTAAINLSFGERIAGVTITIHPCEHLIPGKSSVTLACEAQGSSITREWTKDGNPLSPSNRVTISEDNKTVSINPVEKDDNGEFKCRLSNPINTEEATVMLTVNYMEANSLSTEAIAGIGVACVVFGIVVGVGTSFFAMRKNSILRASKKIKGSKDNETPLPPIPGIPNHPYATVIENPNLQATTADSGFCNVYENN